MSGLSGPNANCMYTTAQMVVSLFCGEEAPRASALVMIVYIARINKILSRTPRIQITDSRGSHRLGVMGDLLVAGDRETAWSVFFFFLFSRHI